MLENESLDSAGLCYTIRYRVRTEIQTERNTYIQGSGIQTLGKQIATRGNSKGLPIIQSPLGSLNHTISQAPEKAQSMRNFLKTGSIPPLQRSSSRERLEYLAAILVIVAPSIVIHASPLLAEVREFALELLRRASFDNTLRETIVDMNVHVQITLIKLSML